MVQRGKHGIVLLLLIAWLGAGAAAAAQTTSATLFGVVTDEQRAVLREAAITLTNLDTGSERSVIADDVGAFQLAGLAPGRYELRVTRSGFAPAVHAPIALTMGEEARIDPVLRLPSITARGEHGPGSSLRVSVCGDTDPKDGPGITSPPAPTATGHV